MNSFLEQYKLFNNEFIFKGKPLKEYLQEQLEQVTWYKILLEEARRDRPDAMKAEEEMIRRDTLRLKEEKAEKLKVTVAPPTESEHTPS